MHAAADHHHHGGDRSILSLRRDPPSHSMDSLPSLSSSLQDPNDIQETDLESFQKQVAERFHDLLSSSDSNELLSVAWTRKLLDMFLALHEQSHHIIVVDRTLNEFYNRSVKALGVCNAVRDEIEQTNLGEGSSGGQRKP